MDQFEVIFHLENLILIVHDETQRREVLGLNGSVTGHVQSLAIKLTIRAISLEIH